MLFNKFSPIKNRSEVFYPLSINLFLIECKYNLCCVQRLISMDFCKVVECFPAGFFRCGVRERILASIVAIVSLSNCHISINEM